MASVVCAALCACADEPPVPEPLPMMTRADSIAAGLITVCGVTVNAEWAGEDYYDFDGNHIERVGTSGTDTDAETGEDGHTWAD